MTQKLSVAVIWHMHQPLYKDNVSDKYLMPWVRLHGIKDYLDMLVILKDYPSIKQTFNLVPSLIDQIQEYVSGKAVDEYMRISMLPDEQLRDEDKRFILRRFFDCNHRTKVVPHPFYKQLLDKRNMSSDIDLFTLQEYNDIIAWFNFVWFDPLWFKLKPALNDLYNKQQNYTYEDRRAILDIQLEILGDIIPTYKKYQDEGLIEITTSPYYHPILPLLVNTDEARVARPDLSLPIHPFQYREDAEEQVKKAINQYESLFGRKPRGIWPSEQSVSPEVIDLLIRHGFQWALSDEGVLAKSFNDYIIRDIHGTVINKKLLYKPYQVLSQDRQQNIKMIFRDIQLSDLLGFSYFNYEPSKAANDLYSRLKHIHNNLPDDSNYLVTIALDGENCWENYVDDGIPFLNDTYKLLEEDKNISLTTVSDYLNQTSTFESIKKIHSGSWINQDYHIWIGAKEKNTAWTYLRRAREDFDKIISLGNYSDRQVQQAKEELYIAEGSDWFWWYGPPNYSDHDDLFDHQFRLHLANVYKILNQPVPPMMDTPICEHRLSHKPLARITPLINGQADNIHEWEYAGYAIIPHTSMHDSNKAISAVYYGNDAENLYFRINIHTNLDVTYSEKLYIYVYLPSVTRYNAPIRLRSLEGNISPVENFLYAYEIALVPYGTSYILQLSEAGENFRWYIKKFTQSRLAMGSVVELAIPKQELGLDLASRLCFVVYRSMMGTIQESYPSSSAIMMDIL